MNKERIVYEWIFRKIVAKPPHGFHRLPPMTAIARMCGVSHVTVARVVHRFVKSGALSVRPGRGITILSSAHGPKRRVVVQKKLLWEETADRVAEDIVAGRFRSTPALPTVAELKEHYGVSFDTMVKVLRYLVQKRILGRERRRYVLHRRENGEQGGCVVLICRSLNGLSALAREDAVRRIRLLEERLALHRIRLVTVPLYYREERLITYEEWEDDFRRVAGDRIVLGFLFFQYALIEQVFAYFASRLQRFKRPIGIHLDVYQSLPHIRYRVGAPVRFFVNQNHYRAGRVVGEFCVARGVTTITWLKPHDNSRWAVERLRGIVDLLRLHGITPTIHTVSVMKKLNVEQVRRSSIEFRETLDALNGRRHISFDPAILQGPAGHLVSRALTRVLDTLQFTGELADHFNRVEEPPSSDAVIGANDQRLFFYYLVRHRQDPRFRERTALIGFDDSPLAFEHGFTSYNFNELGVMDAMTNFIIDPENPLFRRESGAPIEIDGFLSVR